MKRQHGAALLVMLVILVIGAIALFVSALNSSNPQISRDKVTADALAKAKAALIGYAVSDSNRPGELPCPDFNNDGSIDITNDYTGSSCKSLIGWLPWKTLGIPELRDGNGDHLWYALANPFHANGGSSYTLNSDAPAAYSAQMLTVKDYTGTTTMESGVVAIVFSPGSPLTGQTRSPSDNNATNAVANYLDDDNANLDTIFKTPSPRVPPSSTPPSPLINDNLLPIDSRTLLGPVEFRIAREAKKCLDDYAASGNTYNRYPWAAPDSDTTYYYGTYNTLFGRIPSYPNTAMSTAVSTLINALYVLQAAESAYNTNNSSANQTALTNAGQTVMNLQSTVPTVSSTTLHKAGDDGKHFASGTATYSTAAASATTAVNATYDPATNNFDSTMPISWPSGCVINSSYWGAWQNEVFYQVAHGDAPRTNGDSHPYCGASCLTITGSGNPDGGSGAYRAAIIVGRAHNATGSATSNPPSYYLEGGNLHDSGAYYPLSTAAKTLYTYKPEDPSYSSVNDLVVCVDGFYNTSHPVPSYCE